MQAFENHQSDCFGVLRKIFVILKVGKMSNFYAQNQYFFTFLQIHLLGFFKIIPDDRR